jgi:glycosyltransferase involved in cell wall biosynthesis
MNSVFVFDTIPDISHGGGAITAYSILSILCNQSEFVTFLVLGSQDEVKLQKFKDTFDVYHINYDILFCNFELEKSKYKYIDFLFPTRNKLFRYWDKSPEIKCILENLSPDLVCSYHWEALASIIEFNNCPKAVFVGDPMHLPFLFRGIYIVENKSKFSLSYIIHKYIEFTTVHLMKKYMKMLLNQADFCGAFAAHHVNDFNNLLNSGFCKYVHTPTPDPYLNYNIVKSKNKKFKIMHIGHLKGIATLYGIRDIALNILPLLDKSIGEDNYELHVVGGYFDQLDVKLKKIFLEHKSVIIRGQVSPSDIEFITSDLLIVPTSIELGIRVRIITAFSFGLPVVVHIANKKGIPELQHEFNCMIGNTPKQLAENIITLYRNPSLLTSIQIESRNTYLKHFSIESVGAYLNEEINNILK